jgi:hypothetical protein
MFDPSLLAKLVDLGAAGAVIAVVIIFIRSNEKRDREWQEFLNRQRASDRENLAEFKTQTNSRLEQLTTVMTKLTETFAVFATEVHEHIADEDARLDVMLTETQKAKVRQVQGKR